MKIKRIGEEIYELGESPIWDSMEGVLYFVDSLAGAILVMDDGFHSLDFETGKTTVITEPEAGNDELCFNDCKVDRQGRLIAVSMHTGSSDPIGGIYRLDGNLGSRRLDGGLICPNGPCWSPDGAHSTYRIPTVMRFSPTTMTF